MDIMITKESNTSGDHYIEAICGKTTAVVGKSSFGYIFVLCCNASHRAYRGAGRTFNTIEEAVSAYKSPEMKSIIRLLEV